MSRDSVPSPFVVHVPPYPTRFHGGIWKRPVFGMPFVHHVQSHLRPMQMLDHAGNVRTYLGGLGESPAVVNAEGVPLIVDAPSPNGEEAPPVGRIRSATAPWGGNNGLFRTHGDGGGIFNRALAGDGNDGMRIAGFVAGVAVGCGIFWYLTRKKG